MKNDLLYIKAEQNVGVTHKKVLLEDVVKLYSADKDMVQKLNKLVMYTIKSEENVKYTVSILKLIELINKEYPEVEIVNLGESDFVLAYKIPQKTKLVWEYGKAAFVSLTIFFGAAFTIMTFNTDVSVGEVFDKIYELVMGQAKNGASILEIAYSVGIPIGIIVFFNHFSRTKLHNDPTPLQIEMRVYEEDVNKTLIQNSSREGKTIDAN